MPMAIETRPWTRADLERLPDDGNRYEVLDGALLVTPMAGVGHQDAAFAIAAALRAYAESWALAFVVGPGAVVVGDDELQPDIVAFPRIPLPLPHKWDSLPTPLLVVEVLSPSTHRRDLGAKRDAYAQFGVPEYWIVDCDARLVTVIRAGATDLVCAESVRWQPRADVSALEIPLSSVFR